MALPAKKSLPNTKASAVRNIYIENSTVKNNISATDPSQAQEIYRNTSANIPRARRNVETDEFLETDNSSSISQTRQNLSTSSIKIRRRKSKTLTKKNAVKLARRGKTTAVSIEILSWAWLVYVFQLIMALISLLFFGIAYLIKDYLPEVARNTVGDFLYNVGSFVFSVYGGVAEFTLNLFGVSLDAFDPLTFFLICTLLATLAGWITLLGMTFSYLFTFTRCLDGEGATIKWLTLILCVVGYSLPFLNLFPWGLGWLLAVWRYPN